MRKLLSGAIALQACLFLMLAATAQAQDKPKESFVYSTYSVCDLDKQERADEIFNQLDKPILEAAVADGTITAYGYNAHNTGGRWRRAQYYMAPTIQGLLDAGKKMSDQADASKNAKLGSEYAKICNAHDDYIWRRVAGTVGSVTPGGAAFSTYYVCDSREDQADALVEQVYAPVYDKLVAEGKLKSWGWLEHIVGAQFRRLATMSATDMKSLLEARAAINAAFDDNALGDTFTDICDSHADYMWDIKASNP